MKQFIYTLTLLFTSIFLFTFQTQAQKEDTTVTLKVWGNCEMCKKTIETALEVKGIKKANWDTETKLLTVTFNEAKITEEAIHSLIAEAGYDTEKKSGSDLVYAKLPHCCQYQRKGQ